MEVIDYKDIRRQNWYEHQSGCLVGSNGLLFIKGYNRHKSHFTYGWNKDKKSKYKRVGVNGKIYLVHRLVAECFIPNPYNYPTVDHIDRNPSNNCVDNLRWADIDMQLDNSSSHKKKVYQYNKDLSLVAIHNSIEEAARTGDFIAKNISANCHNRLKSHRGYIWSLTPIYNKEESLF